MRLLTLKTVLVATDLDDASFVALSTGKALAESAGAHLHVVHVSDAPDATTAVQSALKRASLEPGDASVHVVGGEPGRAISDLGETIGADVIVLGPQCKQKREEGRRAFGSTALAAVTSATAPCLVIAQPLRLPLTCVVVAVDLSDTSRGALVTGLSWASALRAHGRTPADGTKLIGLYVHQPSQADEMSALDEALGRVEQDAGKWAGITIERATSANPSAAAGIAEFVNSSRADLLVLGTRGLGLDRKNRLGSVSAAVTQQLELPMLLVPPAVWTAYAGQATSPDRSDSALEP
jgi:nucleotide-binding universal stress UspA family protein